MRLTPPLFAFLILLAPPLLGPRCGPAGPVDRTVIEFPGIAEPVTVLFDEAGVPHLFGGNDADVLKVQGFLHARDRFFQMDLTRREASGDLAELLGRGDDDDILDDDIQLRTIGLRRAAERSLTLLTATEVALLQAYSDGVNHFLATQPLPPEYAELELASARPWDVVDILTVGKGLATSLSLDIDIGLMETLEVYVAAGDAADPPFDGAALLFDDVRRFAPMDPASTVLDATGSVPFVTAQAPTIDRKLLAKASGMARAYREKIEGVPFLAKAMNRREHFIGSNEWGVAGDRSASGHPIIANDPHLSLDTPTIFYENHLVVNGDPLSGNLNVSGVSLAGAPGVVLGQNENITWGATTNPMDVSDLFTDKLVRGGHLRPLPHHLLHRRGGGAPPGGLHAGRVPGERSRRQRHRGP